MFRKLFGRNSDSDAVHDLYGCIINQAREKDFYNRLSVPDSLDGRFDMITLHMFLVLRRLKTEGDVTAEFSQKLFDLMFTDMDLSLREMGVGDVGVGKRVKAMVQGFYGRVSAYEDAVTKEGADLGSALERNLYGTVEVSQKTLAEMKDYVLKQDQHLQKQDVFDIMSGRVNFII
ncbi:ubiquinol-cytochrome C chaperone family protein [Kiloniella antarctica]|uniref:Ubiquinol-cytochrome C chaperone family protein n=1 Tax=Kiloniella antarctica TaxID=1550907 RepID=A0ABW5BRY9_9PROT